VVHEVRCREPPGFASLDGATLIAQRGGRLRTGQVNRDQQNRDGAGQEPVAEILTYHAFEHCRRRAGAPICYDCGLYSHRLEHAMNLFSDMPANGVRRPAVRPCHGAGFTLIEIHGRRSHPRILAALVAPNVIRRIDDARVTKAKQDIRAYETALNLYRMDNFRYPTTERVSRLS